MRVLIIRNAFQQDTGGAEQYALNLAISLKTAGHQPIVITKVKKIHEKGRNNEIRVISGPWNDKQGWNRLYYLRFPVTVVWYLYIILRFRINVVHPQGRDDFVFATIAARLLNRRIFWTDHADLKYALDSTNHRNPRMRSWLIKAASHTSAVICASKNEKTEIQAVAPELKNLTVVHNGVFLPKNVVPIKKTNSLIIGTNARLVEAKGISELITGFAKLKRRDADLWLLGGTSGNRKKYESLSRHLGIFEQVKFFDYVSQPNNVVASMDIFVHASYHEAFSLAIIEAAMLGRPIIATRVGGTPEIIDESCGILIKAKSAESITESLRSLLKNKTRRDRLGKAVQKKARMDFDFQKIVVDKIVPLYTGKTYEQ